MPRVRGYPLGAQVVTARTYARTYDDVFAEPRRVLAMQAASTCPDMQRANMACVWTCSTCGQARPSTVRWVGHELRQLTEDERPCALAPLPPKLVTCIHCCGDFDALTDFVLHSRICRGPTVMSASGKKVDSP